MFKFLADAANTTETATEGLTLESIVETVVKWLATEGVKLLIGVIVLLFAFWIINAISKGFKKRMEKKNRDKTITSVVYNIIRKG